MAEYQVEIEFTLEGRERDVDLLERFGIALENRIGEAGPSAAIHGERYSAGMIVDADTVAQAAEIAAAAVTDALNVALAATGDELAEGMLEHLLGKLHVDELALA